MATKGSPLGVLIVAAAAFVATAQQCPEFSSAGIDYADPNISVVTVPSNASDAKGFCCSTCASTPKCKVVMFRPHDTPNPRCILKATATKPIKGHLVIALGPVPPAPPPPPPFRFASVYTSHMVLESAPRQTQVWGFCRTATEQVTVTLDGGAGMQATVRWRAPGVATWSATLPATEASFDAHTVTAKSSSGDVATISDVLFGSVFVASGQSNMAYGLNGSNSRMIVHPPVNNSAAEFAAMRNYAHIRLLRAGYNMASEPALELLPADFGGDVAPVTGWSAPCSDSGVCRVDFSCIAWFFARDVFDALAAAGKPRPIGMIGTYVGGTPDEDWSSPEALKECLDPNAPPPGKAKLSQLWNGMIVPLLNLTITGAIWYQGEADSSHPGGKFDGYNCTFPAMIRDWRRQWHSSTGGLTDEQFPFGFVQLNSVGNGTTYNNPTDATGGDPFSNAWGFAGQRWAQTAGVGYVPNDKMPNVYMAVSLDTPDTPHPNPINGKPGADPGFNVHSPFKQPPAARLARAGLPVLFGVDVDTTGPVAGAVTPSPGGYTVEIERLGSGPGVELRSGVGFELLVDGDTWVSVPVVSHTASSVTVARAPGGKQATKIRYLWYSNPCGKLEFACAVYVSVRPIGNQTGELDFLPLGPFIADLRGE